MFFLFYHVLHYLYEVAVPQEEEMIQSQAAPVCVADYYKLYG